MNVMNLSKHVSDNGHSLKHLSGNDYTVHEALL